MESTDKEGILDKYFYEYDKTGLITTINRNRRGLDAVSGQYEYKYDAIGRLTQSSLNGQVKSAYEYDAFGNRTSLTENDTKTTYKYDELDRLVEAKELANNQRLVKTYAYDKRGNQTKEFIGGLLQKTFTFDATNMLSKVIDASKRELENQYNGLGFRVASIRPEEKIEYLCDLSRDYYNLLERTVNGETESFIYDNNVISMSKEGTSYYYLQDELGSPMYMTGTDGVALSSYAFDDFGRNIDPRTGKQRKHEYTTNGNIIQPFAFTGYREEENNFYYAQVRSYDPQAGRFTGEDRVRGFMALPDSYNRYIYCFKSPVIFVDNNGLLPSILVGAIGGAIINTVSYAVGAAISGEKITAEGLTSSAASGAVVGGLIGAGQTNPVLLGAAGGAAGSLVSGAMSGQSGKELLQTTVQGAVQGGALGGAMATLGPGATVAVGAAMKGGQTLVQELTDDNEGVDWANVAWHTAGGAAETAIAVVGYSKLGGYLSTNKNPTVRQMARDAYNSASRSVNTIKTTVKTTVKSVVETTQNTLNSMADMFMPRPQLVTPEGFVIDEVPSYENGVSYAKSSESSACKDTSSAKVKNWKGEEVKIPEGHKMSPRDPDFSAKPITESGPYTSAQREAFLNGNSADTKLAPHHRHQILVRDGGVIDEIPGPGHPSGNQHTAGSPSRHPAKSLFNSEPGGNTLRANEISKSWIDKGNRLIEIEPGVWIDPGF